MRRTDHSTLRRYLEVLEPMVSVRPSRDPSRLRPVQQGLLAYHGLTAGRTDDRRTPLQVGLPQMIVNEVSDDSPLPASQGEQCIGRAWAALQAFLVASGTGTLSGSLPAVAMFDQLIAKQLPGGALLKATPSDSPDLHWYHELILLHVLGSFALHTQRREAWRAVERAALFHLNETQPDHATSEPWGLFAFLCYVETVPLADQLLHAVQAHYARQLDQVSWMLLSDSLYSLRRHLEQSES